MAASKAPPLRVVAPGEKGKPRRQLTITAAAADGDRLDLLVAMRGRVAKAVEDPNTPARDLAALTRRLMEIAKDIEALELAGQEDESGSAEDEAFDATAI